MVGLDKAGELELRGKTVKLVLDPEGSDPVRFFMFAEDVGKLLSGEFGYVNVFREKDV